jgi:hypothetical protein
MEVDFFINCKTTFDDSTCFEDSGLRAFNCRIHKSSCTFTIFG